MDLKFRVSAQTAKDEVKGVDAEMSFKHGKCWLGQEGRRWRQLHAEMLVITILPSKLRSASHQAVHETANS